MESTLFNNITDDKLRFFKRGQPIGEKIIDFLKYKKEDISNATNIPVSSIRWDRLPSELEIRLIEWANAINLVANFFNDEQKTILWFFTANPLLGNLSPRDMIRLGRFKKLYKFITTALDENKR